MKRREDRRYTNELSKKNVTLRDGERRKDAMTIESNKGGKEKRRRRDSRTVSDPIDQKKTIATRWRRDTRRAGCPMV